MSNLTSDLPRDQDSFLEGDYQPRCIVIAALVQDRLRDVGDLGASLE